MLVALLNMGDLRRSPWHDTSNVNSNHCCKVFSKACVYHLKNEQHKYDRKNVRTFDDCRAPDSCTSKTLENDNVQLFSELCRSLHICRFLVQISFDQPHMTPNIEFSCRPSLSISDCI